MDAILTGFFAPLSPKQSNNYISKTFIYVANLVIDYHKHYWPIMF